MKSRIGIAVGAAVTLAAIGAALAESPEAVYSAVREARPDGRQIAVESLVLERDVFRFVLGPGTFHLLPPVDGREIGAVFLGQGRLELTPADPRESRQLALMSGEATAAGFADGFGKLLLLFADGSHEEILAAGEPARGEPSGEARQFVERWRDEQHKEFRTNLDLRLVLDLNNGANDGVFLAFVDFKNNPPSLVAVDPMGADQLWIGDNLRLGVDGPEESGLIFIGEHNRGFVYLSHTREQIRSGAASNCRRKQLADALHYEVDTLIESDRKIEGTTTVRFKVLAPGLRMLPVRLMSQLRIERAELVGAGGESAELFFVQERPIRDLGSIAEWESSDAAVAFPEPLAAGTEAALRLTYAGSEVLEDAGDGNFYVGSRTSWYPNLGAFADRATYDLTFRVPPGHQVVAVGDPVSEAEAEGYAVSVWRAAHPIAVAGFNYGKFKKIEQAEEVSGVTVQVYTNPGTPNIVKALDAYMRRRNRATEAGLAAETTVFGSDYQGYVPGSQATQGSFGVSTNSLAQAALADGLNGAKLFHSYFGPLPQRRVAITQQSNWSFGQSWPQLIYLPYLAFISGAERAKLYEDAGARAARDSMFFVDQVGLHEMAHQWWGHLVGWESYRDQWLSEGLAEFSTAFAVEQIQGPEAARRFWERARRDITETAGGAGSIRNYEAGPITQGVRLATRRSPGAYRAIVYSKGAFVLHMLRMMMREPEAEWPDARFFAMLKDFAESQTGRNASTADFRAVVQRHMIPELNARGDGRVDWFFEQWVHGTELPRYVSTLTIDKAGKGQYRIHGEVRQEGVSAGFMAIVPIYIDYGKGRMALLGRAPFKGGMAQKLDRTMELPAKPKGIVLNANHEVLALE